MYKVLGIERKFGDFTPKGKTEQIHFDNLNFYLLGEGLEITDNNFAVGNRIDTIKVKNNDDDVKRIFGKILNANELKDYYNKFIEIYYNKYGKVERIELIK